MMTAVRGPDKASAGMYHVRSYLLIPVNDDGRAWRPWTPPSRTLPHSVERAVTSAHVPSLPTGHQPPSVIRGETAQTPALECTTPARVRKPTLGPGS
eukprot:5944080-Prymnesium_polylepis.1